MKKSKWEEMYFRLKWRELNAYDITDVCTNVQQVHQSIKFASF